MISEATIEEVRRRADIVAIAGAVTDLKKKGRYWWGKCPFHKDGTPSFEVRPDKGRAHCFGCGWDGDVFEVVMKAQGMEFAESVRSLADRYGVEVAEDPRTAEREKRTAPMFKAMETAAKLYWRGLCSDSRVHEYLRWRGFTGRTAKWFGWGFSSTDAGLSSVMTAEEYASPLLQRGENGCGLVDMTRDGPRDHFENRFMIPIRDPRGRVCAFAGRVFLPGDERHKYDNSPETVIYRKSDTLYGLYEAREAIRTAGRVFLVEGYLDVARLAQEGVPETVAAGGTALTDSQAASLLRLGADIYICFDGDEAGQKANRRAAQKFLSQMEDGQRVFVITLPAEHDPDSLIREQGIETFLQLIPEATLLSDYVLAPVWNCESLEERAQLIREVGTTVRMIRNAPAMRQQLAEALAEAGGKQTARWICTMAPTPDSTETVLANCDGTAPGLAPMPLTENGAIRLEHVARLAMFPANPAALPASKVKAEACAVRESLRRKFEGFPYGLDFFPRKNCPTCNGSGWILDKRVMDVAPCPDCRAASEAA